LAPERFSFVRFLFTPAFSFERFLLNVPLQRLLKYLKLLLCAAVPAGAQ
jgi:hypothetical protein